MKLFLSWSGDTSKQIAFLIKDWIPLILPNVKPFLSPADIEKGSRWSGEITKELSETNYGIICLTKDNLQSQWLAFEAGALSKSLDSRAATLLLGIKHSEVEQPLAMFQGSLFNRDDMLALIKSINASAETEEQRPQEQINAVFDKFWPDLEAQVNLVLQASDAASHRDDQNHPSVERPVQDNRIDELLALARIQNQILSSPERFFDPLRRDLQRIARYIEDPFFLGMPPRREKNNRRLVELLTDSRDESSNKKNNKGFSLDESLDDLV